MKKIPHTLAHVICGCVLSLFCVSCSTGEPPPEIVPELGQLRTICELSVTEAYYNNVAKFYQEDAQRYLFFFTKDKNFWVEYNGTVRVGLDFSQVDLNVEGDLVTISLPPIKVLSSSIDETSLTEDSFYVTQKSASIDAADQIQALTEAQLRMEEQAAGDTLLHANALERTKRLLSDYVENIGELTNTKYTIQWVYLE